MTEVELTGFDGRNLLAFLSALGTHLVLDRKAALIARLLGGGAESSTVNHCPKAQAVRMSWSPHTFRPTLYLPSQEESCVPSADRIPVIQNCLVRVLHHALAQKVHAGELPPWKNIKGLSQQELRDHLFAPAASIARSKCRRPWADFVTGLASDAIATGSEKEYTALCVITGDSHQDFLGFMNDLRKLVTAEHLSSALFFPWRYREQGKAFRWDPNEDRRYALRASDPAKGPNKEIPSMWGANRLAFEALACFPCFPKGRHLRTTAFEDTTINWPLWSPAIDLTTLRSLLAHPAVVQRDAHALGAMGVFAVASSRRTPVGRKRTFGPASLWPIRTQ